MTSTTEARLHTEIETEKFNRKRTERIIEDDVTLEYPGPIRDADGRIVEEGEIWLIKRSVQTIQTITPMTAYGIWDSPIRLNIEDWAGNYGIMPRGEHWNVLEFASMNELIAFMQRKLVLRWQWSDKLRLSAESRRGLKWLINEKNREVGPVEWDQVHVNENVGALEPSIVTE